MSAEVLLYPGWPYLLAVSVGVALSIRNRRADRRAEAEYRRYVEYREARAALARINERNAG